MNNNGLTKDSLVKLKPLFTLQQSKQQWFELFMVFITVGLFYLAFPSGGFGSATWFALVPVIIVINGNTPRNAFMLGLLAATLGWMANIWWAVNGIAQITSAPANLVILLIFLSCLLFAIPYAVSCWVHIRFKFNHSVSGALASALIFTVLINYIPHILPGNLAHALYKQPLFIQLADIGGVPLVFFVIHSVNLLLGNGVFFLTKNRTKSIQCFILAAFIFFANMAYGEFRLQQLSQVDNSSEKLITIALVQPNIKVKNRSRDDWLIQRKKLSQVLANINKNENIDVIVLPEIPVPVSYQYYAEDKVFFDTLLTNKALLLTAIKPINYNFSEQNGYFNTIELITQQQVTQQYSKQVLLPFGEYIPFEDSFPWLRALFPFAPHYKPGKQSSLFNIKAGKNTINATPLICYEAVFSNIVAKGVAQGGELLINSSNDAWFDGTAGKKIHFALSLFRSIEYRQYLVRVTNTGISGIINPAGILIESSSITPNTTGYSITPLAINPSISFYQNYPNIIKNLLLLLSMLVMVFHRKLYVNY